MSSLYLGIDTSNYTTSIAVVDQTGKIIEDKRQTLYVKSGQKGLRQQEALFQHIKNLPMLFEQINTDLSKVSAIGISTRPRNVVGSYMPVFLAGENAGRIIGKSLDVPVKRFTHQEGHIGCCMIQGETEEEFLSLHISGGTTEVVYTKNNGDNLHTETVGGSLDISMGQLIDRIGVHMGLDFPCGPDLDRLAQNGMVLSGLPRVIHKDGWVNLSGLENYYKALLDGKSHIKEDIVHSLFVQLSDTIKTLVGAQTDRYKVKKVYVAGGVSANSIIRTDLGIGFENLELVFPESSLSTDNAVGVAYLASCKKGWEG